jgi:hypothetical protein
MYVGKGPENNVVITNYFGRFSPIIGEKKQRFSGNQCYDQFFVRNKNHFES